MELKKAEQLANELLREHNPTYKFVWDNAKIRFGCCNYRKKHISLSKHLTIMNDEKHVKDTILHEIAHTLTKGSHHNKVWKKKAIEIGCNGKTTYDETEVRNPKGKFIYECPNCNEISDRHRKMRTKIACKKCCDKYNNGKFTEDYLFVFKGVEE
jgi:predicted SprT family Zn-dependent metalloprotease